jgi:hypothetical protein
MKNMLACAHDKSVHVGYHVIRCNDCGALKTDSTWGIASNMWFANRDDAKFYMTHGYAAGDTLYPTLNLCTVTYYGVDENQNYERDECTDDTSMIDLLKKVQPDSERVVEVEVILKIKRGSLK